MFSVFQCQQNHNVREVEVAFDSDQSLAIVNVVGGFCSSLAQSRTGACRIKHGHPGVIYYSSDGCPDKTCVIIVKRKCSEHVVQLTEEGFKPDLQLACQGDIVQFKWDTTRLNNNFFISRVCTAEDQDLDESTELLNTQSEGLDWNKLEELSELGCHIEESKDVGVFRFQVKTSHDPQHRDMLLLVQPSSQDYDVNVTQSGFLPNHLQIHAGDQVRWQWDSPTVLCNVVQVSDRMKPTEGGFCSGPQTTTGAFIHCFDVPGTYFCVSGTKQLYHYCVIEVFEKPHVYEVEISEEASSPNPLIVSPGDWVYWIWDGIYNFKIKELSTQRFSHVTNRRSYARLFSTEGVHHFLFSSSSNLSNTVMSSILVERLQNFNTVQLSSAGFAPTVTTVAQGDSVTWQWHNSEELHNVFHVVPPIGGMSRRLVPVDGPTAFSSGEPVPNSSFSRTFDHPGTFIVSSDGAPGSQGVVVVVKNGSQVATPTLAQYIANTVPVVYTVHLHCLTDDVDMIYTLDGSYPSLQNDLAEMYDPDVGIVFESPGAYLIRALASKEDMMPSEVMTSRLFFVSEETKQVEAVKHVADSSIEVEEAEGTPQLGSETQEVDSLQNDTVSNDLALSWEVPDLFWEPGTVERSGVISWPCLDWMHGNISSFALFIDGVLYCEMPISRDDGTIPDCRKVEVQDLELGQMYKAVLLGKQQGSRVAFTSDELSFVVLHEETVEPMNIPEPLTTPIDYGITDDEKIQQTLVTQQTSAVTDEHQSNSITGTDVDISQDKAKSSETCQTEEQKEEEIKECKTSQPSEHQEMTSRLTNEEGTNLDRTMLVDATSPAVEQEYEKSVSVESSYSECEEAIDGETESNNEQTGVQGVANEILVTDATLSTNKTTKVQDVADESLANDAPLDGLTTGKIAMDLVTADEVEVEELELITVESETNKITFGEVAGIENKSYGFPYATTSRPLAKLWIEICSVETVTFAWEPFNWDFSNSGSLLLRIEGEHFSSSIDSISTDVHNESESMECDIPSERHYSIHSWKIHGISTSFSVSCCLVGCKYKAWLCCDTSTSSLSEIVDFTIPFPPEAPVLKVLHVLEDEVTLGWLGIHVSPESVLKRYQVYRDGRLTSSMNSSTLETKLSGFQEDTPCSVSVAAVVSLGGRKTTVGERILHSDLVTIYKPLRPSPPQLYQKNVVDQNEAVGIAWTMHAGQTKPIAFDIRVDGVSHYMIPAGCTLDTTLDVSKAKQVNSLNVSGQLEATGKDSGISDEETSVDHSDVEAEHSFILTHCQPRKAYKISVVALIGDKVLEMESGRAFVLPSASLESNCISVVCASVPNPPKLRLENVDHLGISFSWDKPDEFGEAKISVGLVL
jgi:plastocyanin